MKRVFYGICNSESDDSEKQVIISDGDLLEQNFQFDEGDLLTVFFAHKNVVEAPTLVVYVNDTEHEISTSNDIGKYIKTHDVEADCVDAWGDGETVIFAYTKLPLDSNENEGSNENVSSNENLNEGDNGETVEENNEEIVNDSDDSGDDSGDDSDSNTYYWELIDSVHASLDTFGVTQLFDLPVSSDDPEEVTFSTWINSEIGSYVEDTTEALAPNMLKKLYDIINGEVTWTQTPPTTPTTTLGTLTVGDKNVNITYPIPAAPPDETSDLINNGGPNDGGEPFITRVPPADIYFAGGKGLKCAIPSGPSHNPTASSSVILNSGNVTITPALNVSGSTSITNGLTVSGGTTSLRGTNVSGNLVVSGDGKANVLYESNVSLVNKYSKKLVTRVKTHATGTIAGHTTCGHQYIPIAESNLTPLGVIGYNINYNGTSHGDPKFANLWECHLYSSTQVQYCIYNISEKPINVNIAVTVLYVTN